MTISQQGVQGMSRKTRQENFNMRSWMAGALVALAFLPWQIVLWPRESSGEDELGRFDFLVCDRCGKKVLAGATEGDQHDTRVRGVGDLALDVRRDAHDLVGPEPVLVALDDQRQLALEDEVDLLLALVAVDPAPLPGPQVHLADPEAGHAERSPQRDEVLLRARIESRPRDPLSGPAPLVGRHQSSGAPVIRS